jgi:DNA-binding response OmpR family regulator
MKEFFTKDEPLTQLQTTSFEKLKFKARIAFVDDEEISHVDRLSKDGYNITHFPDIDKIDEFVRNQYNVVVLDIQGIGKHISPNKEGWGILKYLKQEHPHIVVIMFTGADWSITEYKDLADLADDFIGKDLEFLDFKAILDNGISKAFSIDYHFEIEKKQMMKELKSSSSISEVKRIIEQYGANETKAKKLLKKLFKNPDSIKTVTNLLTLLNNIRKLATGV